MNWLRKENDINTIYMQCISKEGFEKDISWGDLSISWVLVEKLVNIQTSNITDKIGRTKASLDSLMQVHRTESILQDT